MTFKLSELVAYLESEGLLAAQPAAVQDRLLEGFSSLKMSRPGTVCWLRGNTLEAPPACAALLVSESFAEPGPERVVLLKAKDPRFAFLKAMGRFCDVRLERRVEPTARIHPNAKIGKDVYIGHFCVIGDGVSIGDGTVVHGHVYICCPTRIGKNCIINGGVVIGADGFGYQRAESGEMVKFPHIGGVVIGDNVEIGSNTCIDRGALDDTVIRDGAKVDNLCHVAHNVDIGENGVVIALSMLGGSVVLGRNSWIAPGAVIRETMKIGDGATVGLGAVVVKHVEAGDVVAGVPAKSIKK